MMLQRDETTPMGMLKRALSLKQAIDVTKKEVLDTDRDFIDWSESYRAVDLVSRTIFQSDHRISVRIKSDSIDGDSNI